MKLVKRLGVAIAATLMWLAFSFGALVIMPLQLLGIIAWLISGNERVYRWVKDTGKGMDGVNNAAWFGGHPKETISSHAGRWLAYRAANPADDIRVPWWVPLVDQITGVFDENHCVKSIEEPFRNLPME